MTEHRASRLGNIISPDNSSGDYAATGFDFAELNSAIDDNNSAHGQIGNTFVSQDSGLSRNKTQAFIENGAVVRAGEDLSIEAEDTTEHHFRSCSNQWGWCGWCWRNDWREEPRHCWSITRLKLISAETPW